ncbi:acid protease [Auriculariales sp. MPI-PUGE-AT-0066]|nr:acid protease [Auriculariales sp. MPI-PUGE-AT-0066]
MSHSQLHRAYNVWQYAAVLAFVVPRVFGDPGAPPANVPLQIDAISGRIFASVVMGFEHPQQVNFAVSTGLRYSAVASPQCPSCSQSTYNPSSSSSYQAVDGNVTSLYGGIDLSGGLMREDCGFKQTDGTSLWKWPNQTLVLSRSAEGVRNVFSSTIGGVIGMSHSAPQGGAATDTVLGHWLGTHPKNSSFQFGLALNDLSSTHQKAVPSDEEDTGAGRLHMAAVNETFFNTTALKWLTASSSFVGTDANAGYPSDYVFDLQGWKFDGPDSFTISSASSAQAIFEPLFPAIVFPAKFANSIYGSLTGAQEVADSNPKQWTLPCDMAELLWTANYNGLEIQSRNLVLKSTSGGCVGAIQGWQDETTTTFLLGAPAMANAYVIHQTDQHGLSQVGVAPRLPLLLQGRSKSSRNAIIGGVVGGVVGGLILIAIALWFFRRTISRSERTYVNEVAPVPVGAPSTPGSPWNGTNGAPMTANSMSSSDSTFAAQQAATMSQVGNGKGRSLYTSVSRPGDAPASGSGNRSPSEAGTVTSSVPSSRVPSSRRPMLPPAYEA